MSVVVWRRRVLPARSSSPRWGWAGRRKTAHLRCGYSRPWCTPLPAGVVSSQVEHCSTSVCVCIYLWIGLVFVFILRLSSIPRRVVPAGVWPARFFVRRRWSYQTNSGAAPATAFPPPPSPPTATRWRERPIAILKIIIVVSEKKWINSEQHWSLRSLSTSLWPGSLLTACQRGLAPVSDA